MPRITRDRSKWFDKARVDAAPPAPSEQQKPTCEHCGTPIIDNCLRCGAPQCCPKCCESTTREAMSEQQDRLEELRRRVALAAHHGPSDLEDKPCQTCADLQDLLTRLEKARALADEIKQFADDGVCPVGLRWKLDELLTTLGGDDKP